MSWYVKTLVRYSKYIKETTYNPKDMVTFVDDLSEDDSFGFISDPQYLDMFNDLLAVEKAIKVLRERKTISDLEMAILILLSDGNTLTDIAIRSGVSQDSAKLALKTVTDKVGFYLGSVFTDEGYLDYLVENYNLTDEQMEKAERYMNNSRGEK